MTTDPISKLVHGSKEINVHDAGKYMPGIDFLPPALVESAVLAHGTTRRRYTPSTKVSSSPAGVIPWRFSIQCRGTTEGVVKARARKLVSFLRKAGTRTTPLEFHYRGNSDIVAEPLWGTYGGNTRYTFIHANTRLSRAYSVADRRGSNIDVIVDSSIAPTGDGSEIDLLEVKGGVIEDAIGTGDGSSRGLVIPEATTNKMTNPIFGHSTWDNGWTADTNIIDSQNTSAEFLHPGALSSAKLTATAATLNIYTMTINVGNTNTHEFGFYVKLPDSGAVSATQCRVYYGGAKTSTYTEIGNGVYRVSWSGAGVASGTTTGIQVMDGYTVYLMAAQLEEKAYSTPLCHGDMLGCSWSGTEHASTSVRVASEATLDASLAFPTGEGTIRAVVKVPFANDHGSNARIWQGDTSSAWLSFFESNDTWRFYDGTNTAVTSAQIFSAGDILVFHCVYSADGLVLYVDGSQAATNGTYTPDGTDADIFLGSDSTPANYSNVTFLDFAVYSTASSAAEVLADYTNIAAIVDDGGLVVGRLPWFWTKDGDSIIDNCNDSDDDDWGIIGGVPGTVAAQLKFRAHMSSNWSVFKRLMMANLCIDPNDYLDPVFMINDGNSTANAAYCGGGYDIVIGMSTSWANFSGFIGLTPRQYRMLAGRELLLYTHSMESTTNTVHARIAFIRGSDTIYGDAIVTANTGGWRVLKTPTMRMLDYDRLYPGDTVGDIDIRLNMKYASASPTGFSLDYSRLMAGDQIMILGDSDNAVADDGMYYDDGTVSAHDSLTEDTAGYVPLTGDKIDLLPDKYNMIHIVMGDLEATPTPAGTLTFDKLSIVPRYALL